MYIRTLGELALGSRLKAISDQLYDTADAVYRAHGAGIEARAFPVLRYLLEFGTTGVTELAVAIGQSHAAVSQVATRLIRQGLVHRARDRDDARRSLLALTAEGRRRLTAVAPIWDAIREGAAAAIARSGVDLMGALAAFEAELARSQLVDEILRRHATQARERVRIEPYRKDWREHFFSLNADWLNRHFKLEDIDVEILSQPERVIIKPGGAIFFAALGDEVIGTCALLKSRAGEYELGKMAVLERYRGLGVGRKLLYAAIAEFERRGGKRLFLESNRKLAPALALYRSVGFVEQPTIRDDSHYARADIYMIYDARAAAKRDAGNAHATKRVTRTKTKTPARRDARKRNRAGEIA